MSNELINMEHRKEADGKMCAGVCKSCNDKAEGSWKLLPLLAFFVHWLSLLPTSLTAGDSCLCLFWTTPFPRSVSSWDGWRLCFPSSKLNGVTGRLSSTASLGKKMWKISVEFQHHKLKFQHFFSYQNSASTQVAKLRCKSAEPCGSLCSSLSGVLRHSTQSQ